jgi:hypothetical protein
MALYASFLALVGVPLMMLCVDVARAYIARVRLVNATEAACTAYAHTLDIEEFKIFGRTKPATNALSEGWYIFTVAAPAGASFSPSAKTLKNIDNPSQELLEVKCRSSYTFHGIFRDYGMSHFSMAEARFAFSENWP